jgi:hypothetical protein
MSVRRLLRFGPLIDCEGGEKTHCKPFQNTNEENDAMKD